MHKSTSPKRKSFKRFVIVTTTLVAGGSAAALMAGVTPAMAANLANQPDAPIVAFMVPLTILVLAMLYEAGRIALRGNLPREAPVPRRPNRHWSAASRER